MVIRTRFIGSPLVPASSASGIAAIRCCGSAIFIHSLRLESLKANSMFVKSGIRKRSIVSTNNGGRFIGLGGASSN